MENVRIAVLNAYDQVCAFMDNGVPGALHLYADELHSYREGSANTFQFTAPARHEDARYLVEGNKLSFFYNGRPHYFNIVKSVRTEYTVEVTAYALMFELLNDELGEYKAGHAMTFEEYLEVFDTSDIVELGLNEVSDQAVTNEWTGTATILARLFSLANVFHAEVEFVPELNRDYSLKRLVMNVYKENDGECQGIGRKRNDITLRYGVNVKGITKSSDITGLRTAIRPVGTDGLMVTGLDKNEFDSNGNLEFTSPVGDGCIYAVQARQRFPSNLLNNGSDGYVVKVWSYSTDNVNVLYGQALAELKKACVPQVSYEVDGYFDTEIGDTVLIVDDEFVPELYLEARVTEQVRSFTEPGRNKTVFDNFTELQAEVDGSLLDKMNELIRANKVYSCMISSDNGIVFRNGAGETTLTANVRNAGSDVTGLFVIQWKKDGVIAAIGRSLTVRAEDVGGKAVYEFEAWDSSNILRGAYEVTVTSISDGKDGKDGENGKDGEDGKNGTDGVGILSVVNKYAVSFSGNLVPEEWLDTVPVMTTANRYLWNYEIITYTDGTVYETEKHVIGVYGNTGEDGPATGVTVSEVEPPEKFIGMLWKHTGGVPGLIKGATYRWNGKAWELYVFVADNIDVNSIFAKDITATGVIRGAELIGASGSFSGSIKCNGSIYMYSPVYGREFKFIDVQYTSVLDNTTITFYDVFGNPFMEWSTASVGADIVAFPQSVFCQKDITARYVRTTGGVDLNDVDKAVNALKGLKVIDKGSVVLSPGGKKYAMLKRFPASPSRPPYTIVATNGHQNANDAYPVGTTLWQNSNSQWEAYVYFSAASTVAMRINYIIFGDT